MTQNDIRACLAQHKLIPVVTFNHVNEVAPMMEKLSSQNIKCIEITLRTSAAFECIAYCIANFGDEFTVGVGTIINTDQIDQAVNIGVDFIVSPGLHDGIIDALKFSNIPFIPGVATPSEIMKAINLGWDTFKFFPAHLFGGLEALKAYGQLFPHVKFCPTGGIDGNSYQNYLDLNNIISVGGSWMTK